MTEHHHHHHPHGHAHPPAAVGRRSCGCRWSSGWLGRGCADRAGLGGGVLGDALMTVHVTAPQLQFRDLTLGYDRHPAVHHLSGEVPPGALLAVVGPNGAGKSTLFKGIVGALKPLAGRVDLNGLAAQDIAYLPQAAEIDRTFPISVYDLVAMGLWRKTGAWGGFSNDGPRKDPGCDRRRRAHRLRAARHRHAVGRADAAHAVRAAACCRTQSWSCSTSRSMPSTPRPRPTCVALVQSWHKEGRTILAALHDLDLVRANFPQTLLLAREQVAWGDTASVLTADNMQKARHMCEAFDEEAAACAA